MSVKNFFFLFKNDKSFKLLSVKKFFLKIMLQWLEVNGTLRFSFLKILFDSIQSFISSNLMNYFWRFAFLTSEYLYSKKKMVKDFSIYIIGKSPVVKVLVEIGDSNFNFWVRFKTLRFINQLIAGRRVNLFNA